MLRAWTILSRTGVELYESHCFARAASLAYYAFLALFPALLFVVSLASVLPVQPLLDRMVTMLGHVAPDEVVAIAREQFMQIAGRSSGAVLAFSLLGALWSMSSGMTTLADVLNQAHRVADRRPWWRVRLTAMLLSLTLAVASLPAFSLVVAGPRAVERAGDILALGPFAVWTWNVVRWPAACALVVIALRCIYHFAPDTSRDWVWISPGAVTATAIWLLASLVFREYVRHFADYQKTYGAIGGAIVTLLWFYFTSLAVLIGAQLDATTEHFLRNERDVKRSASPPPATDLVLK